MRLFDIRLVIDREGQVRASVEGRRVAIAPSAEPSVVLAELARRIDGAAWAAGRPELEELGDPASELYGR